MWHIYILMSLCINVYMFKWNSYQSKYTINSMYDGYLILEYCMVNKIYLKKKNGSSMSTRQYLSETNEIKKTLTSLYVLDIPVYSDTRNSRKMPMVAKLTVLDLCWLIWPHLGLHKINKTSKQSKTKWKDIKIIHYNIIINVT